MRKLLRVEGYVWCERHGNIHVNSLNPYDYVDDSSKCRTEEHFAVYARQEVPEEFGSDS